MARARPMGTPHRSPATGSTSATAVPAPNRGRQAPPRSYAAAGPYTVTLVVTDTGGHASSPATASITVTAADAAPTARLTVSQLASPALTVKADGSGSTDGDATPIASYRFDFGDGSAAVTTQAPTATAQHSYAAAGTYTVTLVVTDTGGHASSPPTASITASATDAGPTARLTVSQLASPALTVKADGSGSTDGDATPIASYRFTFGDGTAAVTTQAPTATAQHSYAAAGTYTVTLVATDTGGNASAPATASINVTGSSGSGTVAVYAGYYDTHHA